MRKSTYHCLVLLAVISVFSGCTPPDDPTGSPPAAEQGLAQMASSDIIFRGRYFRSKECREDATGALGLGMWGVCEVDEVVEGDLKLRVLKDVRVPADVVEGLVYTFRWKISDSDKEYLRKAQDSGYTGIWLDHEFLELVRDGGPDR